MALDAIAYSREIMANGTDRVHRMNGEVFQRLRNDHEQFLEAYESE